MNADELQRIVPICVNLRSSAVTKPPYMQKIKVAQFGLGPIGIESIRLAAEKDWLDVVGGVDIDPKKIGKSLGEITGAPKLNTAKIYATFDELFEAAKPTVVLHTA